MKKSKGKAIHFFKRNALYLILATCILAIGLSIALALLTKNTSINMGSVNDSPMTETPINPPNDDVVVEQPDGTPDIPVSVPIEFIIPIENATGISEYSEQMVFNSTLGRFASHKAIDFYAVEGTPVMAVYAGTVESVENTLLHGTTITIDHGNGLKTIYNSLADGDSVVVGQVVDKGQVIGEVSVTNRQEYKDGAHLHFEVIEDGQIIDPTKYLDLIEK